MKRIMPFMMLMLGTISAAMAEGAHVPATDYDAMIGTFAVSRWRCLLKG